jgi:hypothetical protein
MLPAALSAAAPHTRRYRIDAAVTAFGVQVFSRQGVGEAIAELRVERTERGRRMRFRFGGASHPERTRGILQMGHFEEDLEEAAGNLVSSRFFGFLTSAPEGQKPRANSCCAVEGALDPARFRFRKTYEAPLPDTARFRDIPRLRNVIHESLDGICAKSCSTANARPEARRSFLKTLADAVEAPGDCFEGDYHYGDRVLRFRAKKSPAATGLACLEAQVQGRGRHRFAFYFRPSAPIALPERVEYWPRLPLAAGLRLTLVPLDEPQLEERSS